MQNVHLSTTAATFFTLVLYLSTYGQLSTEHSYLCFLGSGL